jgi:hypothetical protein
VKLHTLPLRLAVLLLPALTVGVTSAAAPSEAKACGGTFCDNGPQPMPVDQTGENILFVRDGSEIEAQIQIQYEGEAERFAWIVPVTAVPEVTPGSQPLFDRLLAGTVPTFLLSQVFEDCPPEEGGGGLCGGLAMSADEAGSANDLAGGDGDGDGDPEEGPTVLDRGTAGVFQYAVIEDDNAQAIIDWLDENDFAQDDDAAPILQEYIDEDFVFLAVKLQAGAEVEEIHPLSIRYQGDEPCVPIRLTRIAASEDMGIRTFFLGDDRWAPENYEHVLINPLMVDWAGGQPGENYVEVVSMAVDEAGGKAFVTEYAGTSEVVAPDFVNNAWNPAAFTDIEVINAYGELSGQGLMNCDEFEGCVYSHPLAEPLVAQYLPVPDGVGEVAFYTCLECYEELIDMELWDGAQFSADFNERILGPAIHAEALLDDHDYLTRMFTTMSPHEMVEDPLFLENPDLPEASNQWSATRTIACEGPDWIELADGTIVALEDDGTMHNFEGMAWARQVERVPSSGAPQSQMDNAADIDDMLADWNDEQLSDDEEGCAVDAGRHGSGILAFGMILGVVFAGRRRRFA